jgi:hypothetical protein
LKDFISVRFFSSENYKITAAELFSYHFALEADRIYLVFVNFGVVLLCDAKLTKAL